MKIWLVKIKEVPILTFYSMSPNWSSVHNPASSSAPTVSDPWLSSTAPSNSPPPGTRVSFSTSTPQTLSCLFRSRSSNWKYPHSSTPSNYHTSSEQPRTKAPSELPSSFLLSVSTPEATRMSHPSILISRYSSLESKSYCVSSRD